MNNEITEERILHMIEVSAAPVTIGELIGATLLSKPLLDIFLHDLVSSGKIIKSEDDKEMGPVFVAAKAPAY